MASGRGRKTSQVHDAGALFGAPTAPPAHYHDHRSRLRKRFADAGESALQDYELLELLLFRTIPRRDTKPLAKLLIERFGDLPGVLGADPARLAEVPGAGEAVALDLKAIQATLERVLRTQARKRQHVGSWTALVDYCRTAMQHETREQFRVLFLDVKNQMIADEVMGTGTHDHAPVYTREVMRRALELRAAALILVHNHPDYSPSITHAHA